jgi:hypothetical protein
MQLDGMIIPRRIKRMFDQRAEPRAAAIGTALLGWRGQSVPVGLENHSASGAMVVCGEIPHIGEAVVLTLPERAPIEGFICWVRDGRIGIYFAAVVR